MDSVLFLILHLSVSASYLTNVAHRSIKYSYSKEGQEQHNRTFFKKHIAAVNFYVFGMSMGRKRANAHGGEHR